MNLPGYYDHHRTPRAFLGSAPGVAGLFLQECKHGRGRLMLPDNFLRGGSNAATSCERQQTAETCNYPVLLGSLTFADLGSRWPTNKLRARPTTLWASSVPCISSLEQSTSELR
jgi:hypothetical protein